MKKLLFIIFLFCSIVITGQTTYYVAATGGSNGNAGTSGSPWATLAYAAANAGSGNIIYMQAGTHTINTTVVLPIGVSLTGAGETSIITSTALTAEWTPIINMVSDNLANGNQTISYLKFDGASFTIAQAFDIRKRSNVKIHHCEFINFKYFAIYWVGDGGYGGEDPYTGAYPPTNYVTGSEFNNNILRDCSVYDSYGRGSIYIGGHEGMLIHNNVIAETTRTTGLNGYCIKIAGNGGWMKGVKIYNNTLFTSGNEWLFAIESFFIMGAEIYNNTMLGGIDVNFSWRGDNNEYAYGTWIHNNTLGPVVDVSGSTYYTGIFYEFRVEDNIIEKNLFRNCAVGIHHTMRTPAPWVYNENIRYNIFYNSGRGSYHSVIRFGETENNFVIDSLNIFNNVFHTETSGGAYFGLHMRGFSTALKVRVINNIFENFTASWFESNRGSYFDSLYIQNNVLYNNPYSNEPTLNGTPTHYTNSGNIKSNPLFTNAANGDFTIPTNSPAKDAGINVGLTSDYLGNAVPYNTIQDIGAYEFGSSSAIPVTSVTVTGAGNATTITSNQGTLQMSAAILPVNATLQTVTWSKTDGTGTGTISVTGLVTATSNGIITVTATANDGSGVHGHLDLTFSNQSAVLVTGITVTGAGSATTIATDNGTLQMTEGISPANATLKTVTWSVINGTGGGSISSSGLLTALADGTVTTRATANDGSGIYGDRVITISNQIVAPFAITNSLTGLHSIDATFSGSTTGASITDRGFCWGTEPNPILINSHVHVGTGEGTFTYKVSLTSATVFHVRSFSTNSKGTVYGNDISFTTPAYTIVTSGGKVLMSGGKVVIIK
jgi:uncharacterized protein YjdB